VLCKPIDQLRPDDLERFPIWEFATDEESVQGQDETWVRPINADSIPLGAYSLSVAAKFITPSGRELIGIVGISTGSGIEIRHAALLADNQYIFVPALAYWNAAAEYEKIATQLQLVPADTFPLQYKLLCLVAGETSHRHGSYG